MQFSRHLQTTIAAWLGGTPFPEPPPSLKLALSLSDPGPNGASLVEPTDPDYARQAFTLSEPVASELDGTQATTSRCLFIGDYSNVTHAAAFDNSGRMLWYAPTSGTGTGELLAPVQITLRGLFSAYLAEAVINWMRGAAFPAPSDLTLGVLRGYPGRDASSLDEPVDRGYARKAIAFGAPSTGTKGTEIASTNSPFAFGPAIDEGWGEISHFAVFARTQDMLVWQGFSTPNTIAKGSGITLGRISFLIK